MLGAVCTSLLNVRSMPTTTSSIIGQLTEGMVIKGEELKANWLQFDYQNTFGFISSAYLRPISDLSRLVGTVNTDKLNIRQSPSASAKHLATLNRGASIKTLAFINDWLEKKISARTKMKISH